MEIRFPQKWGNQPWAKNNLDDSHPLKQNIFSLGDARSLGRRKWFTRLSHYENSIVLTCEVKARRVGVNLYY